MDANEIDKLLRKWRRKPLWSLLQPGAAQQQVLLGRTGLQKLLPQGPPFLLCQELRCFADAALESSPSGLLLGSSFLDPADPLFQKVFQGHFPGQPVFPGVLQLEMVGQLALCLGYFQEQIGMLREGRTIAAPQRKRVLNLRASKVLGACYLAPVLPGQNVELQACQLGPSDGLFARMLGQLLVDGQVAMVCAQEVCFVDGERL